MQVVDPVAHAGAELAAAEAAGDRVAGDDLHAVGFGRQQAEETHADLDHLPRADLSGRQTLEPDKRRADLRQRVVIGRDLPDRVGMRGVAMGEGDARHGAARQTIAKMRAGPPVPRRCFGAPTIRVAPAAGTASSPARHSIP